MQLPSPKDLEKLAKACRKAGITHFKCGDFEFTLGDAPAAPHPTKVAPQTSAQGEIESNGPTPEELLFWSSIPMAQQAADMIGSDT